MKESLILAEQQADVCKIFANTRRIMILWTLLEEELAVGDIAESVGATSQNTSHHLRLMKDKGILYSRRQGQSVLYGIANSELVECLLEKGSALTDSQLMLNLEPKQI